jgi:hypothetical protein
VHWQLVSEIVDDDRWFVLDGGTQGVRVAVGIPTSGASSHPDLLVGAGNVVWLGLEELDEERVLGLLEGLPADIAGAGANERWARWMRTEHRARRSSLSGHAWCVRATSRGWSVGESEYDDLLDALTTIPDSSGPVDAGAGRISQTYPTSGFAFDRLARRAARNGLVSLEGTAGTGFRASFASGSTKEGPSLPELFARV